MSLEKRLPSVAVVMATYNGERFLKEQLDSIIKQDYCNLTTYIRDDGSTDKTVSIIKEYSEKYEKIKIIHSDGNVGVPESFYRILRQIKNFDYYAFADQDDVWESDKISNAVEKMETYNSKNIPILYCSSFDYVDNNLQHVRDFAEQPETIDFYRCIYYTPGLGFTIVFNDELKKLALPTDVGVYDKSYYGEYHDRRFIRTAVSFGKIIYDKRITAHHVRLDSSVTSDDNTNASLLTGWVKEELYGTEANFEKIGIKKFLYDYEDILDEKQRNALELFSDDGHKLKKLLFPHRLRTRIAGEIALRILFVLGRI